ncbi:class I SAM-dependent methyltransferase [Nakamurella lactea]|uniref:class I SAM-dependent methyltransferase n=1 Tax=Nakamurella lactea TaxID=459515 RepID=UPI00040A0555|nr:methyltransferase domain-containing protein [Nakamurella lactea]
MEQRIWAEVYGEEFPAAANPHSYVSVSELERFDTELQVGSGDVLADLGCGRGGPGLWVAGRRRARLVGIDIAATALDAARARAEALGMADSADFRLGSFADTGLATGTVQAVMSADALLFAPDKSAAIAELARILMPSGRAVLTSWDYSRQPVGRPPQLADHRPLLQDAGFDVIAYQETEHWRDRQTRTTDLMLRAVDELAAESGRDPAKIRVSLEEMQATIECMSRRVFIVAGRRG